MDSLKVIQLPSGGWVSAYEYMFHVSMRPGIPPGYFKETVQAKRLDTYGGEQHEVPQDDLSRP